MTRWLGIISIQHFYCKKRINEQHEGRIKRQAKEALVAGPTTPYMRALMCVLATLLNILGGCNLLRISDGSLKGFIDLIPEK